MSHDVHCRECCEEVPVPADLHWKELDGHVAYCEGCLCRGKCAWSPVDHGAIAVFTPFTPAEEAAWRLTLPPRGDELDEHQREPLPGADDEWDVDTEPTLPSFDVQLYGAAVNEELVQLGEAPANADELRELMEAAR